MKKTLLLAIMATSFGIFGEIASELRAQEITPTSKIEISPIEQFLFELWDTNPFQYYTQTQRVQVIEELKAAFKDQYAAWDVKKLRLGINLTDVFDQAIELEMAIPDSEMKDVQAFANVAFLDRLQQLQGQIHDTHVTILPNKKSPKLRLGLHLKLTEGKIFVTGRDKRLTNYTAERYPDSKLNDINWGLDWEVISIDAQKVEDQIKQLLPYISASSNAFAYEEAITALTLRNFAYPNKTISEVIVFNKDEDLTIKLKLPWYQDLRSTVVTDNNYRPDVAWFFKLKGYVSADAPATDWVVEGGNPHTLKFGSIGYIDYDYWEYPLNLKDARHYYNNEEEDESVLQTGHFLLKGISMAYIKINTFNKSKVFDSEQAEQAELIDVLSSFLKEIQSEDLGIIVDVRYNGGGDPNLAFKIASLLSTKGIPAPTHANYRLNPAIVDYIFNDLYTGNIEEKDPWIEQELETVKAAHAQDLSYSIPFQRRLETETGINELPFIVLTGPQCVSACDGFNWVIKDNNLAPLVGRPSNGTGAGFVSNDVYFNQDFWKDSQAIVKAKIPNRLFGRPIPTEVLKNADDKTWFAYNTENVPAPVDIEYSATLNDYKNQDEDLMAQAKRELLKYINELGEQ